MKPKLHIIISLLLCLLVQQGAYAFLILNSAVAFNTNNTIRFQYRLRYEIQNFYLSKWRQGPKSIFEEDYNLSVHPLEPVFMMASRNHLNLGIKKDTPYCVPAFLAAACQQAIIDGKTEQELRAAGNSIVAITALLTAIPSFNTSTTAYFAYLASVAAVVDNKIIAGEWQLNANQDFKDKYSVYYDAWNIAHSAANIATVGIGAYGLVNNLRHLNTIKSIKSFHSQYSQIKGFNHNSKLLEVLNEIKAAKGGAASWGKVFNYRHGGQMSAIEHILYRHSYNSGFSNVSRFSKGTNAKMIKGYVDQAVKHGNPIQGGFEYNFGKVIGIGSDGAPATSIRVYIRDGWVRTAFPF